MATHADAALVMQGIGKCYQSQGQAPVDVLHALDLSLDPGDFVALMGPSGSGKSTLMNLLGCLDTPSAGRYRIGDTAVDGLSGDALAALRNRFFGFVFQGFNLLPRANLIDNVALPLMYAGLSHRERQRRALDMLDRVGLAGLGERTPARLSGGQQQRVAIARALANEPAWVLADEPTGNLDSATSAHIMALFDTLNSQGVSIIMVTHEEEIAAHARRVIRLQDGRIQSDRSAGAPGNHQSVT
ncbi:MAG: ABC transporter ATP-binding protein [Denitromonas halophila]|nr:MAG: ABC transporter ATP-binding protein [Denitromonas halophila]TVT71438.1 MAG: ABC transporter ATP-binding protein [Denitromonas halophila]